MKIATIKLIVNVENQLCFSCVDQLFKNLTLNAPFSLQGLSRFGAMVSKKTGMVSGLESSCLSRNKFIIQLPRQQQELSTLEPRLFSGMAVQLVDYSCGRSAGLLCAPACFGVCR